MGTGTRDNGDFKYISASRNLWMVSAPKQASLRRNSNHHTAFVKNMNRKSSQPITMAEEITRLKKLWDDEVITKKEYEAEKKKLLDGN